MAKAKIRWNIKGFEEIRRLPAMDAVLRTEVDRVLAQTGTEHYAGGVEPGRTRSRGYVVTSDYEGMKDNAENHTLLRALGGGSA